MKLNPGFKTGREGRRMETRKQQREARGQALHPRGLARSVAKAMGAGKDWRKAVAQLPKEGRKRIRPKTSRSDR